MYHEYQYVCVSKWNPGASFKSERGIRQADPTSLYIFIIYAEYLGRYFHFMTNVPKSNIVIKKVVLLFLINVCR